MNGHAAQRGGSPNHLLIGFDSAWTAGNRGGLVGVLVDGRDTWTLLTEPIRADFDEAGDVIDGWRRRHRPATTRIFMDQPTIVPNARGQRPVEHLVASPVSRLRGGVQPAYRERTALFGDRAPLWPFLAAFGEALDLDGEARSAVIETWPALTLAAMEWTRDTGDGRRTRLPKYNPAARRTFSPADWRWVCDRLQAALGARAPGLRDLADWVGALAGLERPRKADQDRLDACLCLWVSVLAHKGDPLLRVGRRGTGLMVVPYNAGLAGDLRTRARVTGRCPDAWVQLRRCGTQV